MMPRVRPLEQSLGQCFLLTKGPTFHVTANFHIIGFWTGWSYFSMSFDTQFSKLTGPQTLTCLQCFFLTKGPTFHVTANFYIIGFLTGWSYFSMSFDWLAAKVDCDWLSFGM